MLVRALNRIGDREPLLKRSTMAVIESDDGTILAVAVELGQGLGHVVAHAGDPEFNNILRELGIDKTTICEDFRHTPLPELMEKPEA